MDCIILVKIYRQRIIDHAMITIKQNINNSQFCSNFTVSSASFSGSVFNAKEKDYESGFHYYGSRYYSSELSIWNSTDPMADKYPSLTPYNYCANNPVKLIDPNGEEFDPASKEKYVEPYKKEINARKEFINNLRGTDKWDDNYETQYNEYTKILTEISTLEEDPNNIYKIKNGVNLGKDIQGEVSYGGKDGNKNVINISLASKCNNVNLIMEPLAHELKHTYQFYEGKLGFVIDDKGKQITASNSKHLEQEAFTRGAMFSGNSMLNNGKFRLDYDLNHRNYILPERYSKFPDYKQNIIINQCKHYPNTIYISNERR